jgi:hypothetical protein
MKWLVIFLFLSGCGLSGLGLLSGSKGPQVNSNAQVGKENRQSVLSYEEETVTSAGRDVVTTEVLKEVETGTVEKLDIINTNIPPWVLLLLILGWLLPTPTEIARGFVNFILSLFRRRSFSEHEEFTRKGEGNIVNASRSPHE